MFNFTQSEITAIGNHLNVGRASILKIEEWATVILVVIRGKGARFVSKKVLAPVRSAAFVALNKQLSKIAQGRVSIQWSAVKNSYYVEDNFSGPGGKIVDLLAARERLNKIYTTEYASHVCDTLVG